MFVYLFLFFIYFCLFIWADWLIGCQEITYMSNLGTKVSRGGSSFTCITLILVWFTHWLPRPTIYRAFSQELFWSFFLTSNSHCSSSSQRICMKFWGTYQWVPLYLFQALKREPKHCFPNALGTTGVCGLEFRRFGARFSMVFWYLLMSFRKLQKNIF